LDLAQRLEHIIANLSSFSQLNILHQWSWDGKSSDLQLLPLNEKGIILFDSGGTHPARNRHINIQQTWCIPESVNGLPTKGATLRLSLLWWASLAEIYINGNKIHTGDLFDQKCRLLLAENAESKRAFTFNLKLTAPKHDRGALQKSEILIEYPHQPCDPGKFATELAVIQAYLPHLSAANFRLEDVISQLELLLSKITHDIGSAWLSELANIRRSLLPIGEFLKQRKVYLLGNAHIDVAWLWAIAETKDVMQRTFSSALQLQKDYPELIFNQSTALSYVWMEEANPELFAQIQTAVQEEKWEVIGGMWVEPDCNLPSGESLIRQILYGKNYFRNKFNRDIKIAWLPDTFGFNWQLPQILSKSGFEALITQKLTWNDTNKFPHQIFWWQGVDGSQIFTYFSNEIGLGIEPVAIAKFLSQQEQKHHVPECLWLYGVGDRGGGPTADMLNIGREWANSEIFFTLAPSTAEDFILKLKQDLDQASIPCWQDELYLEFHRGTYTTKAAQKRQHRQAEILITNTEKLCAIASIMQKAKYPRLSLEKAWQGLMLNQFHDILPGTSIPEVLADADLVWAEVRNLCVDITNAIFTPSQAQSIVASSFTLWNFQNWLRTEVVEIDKIQNFTDTEVVNLVSILSSDTIALPIQRTEKGLLIVAQDIPSFGAVSCKLLPANILQVIADIPTVSMAISDLNSEIYLENQYLKVTINSQTGEIAQIFDRRYGNSLLSQPCELQFFEDKGQYWDAWNIDPDYEKHQLAGITLESIEVQEQGPIRISVRIVRKFGRSRFQQDIYLDAYSAFFTVTNHVDWQEDYVLVKVAFPLSFSAPSATYEIPMGAIARSTMAETPEAKAKFEVSAQFWADLSSDNVGLSVLNDCKYGYDAKPNQLRLTLLRSPNWPCPDSDKGIHEFTYRLLPHQGSWRDAQVVCEGYNLNNALMISPSNNLLEPEHSDHRFSFIAIASNAIVISALKLAEDSLSWILRLYEAHGELVTTEITFHLAISSITECDLMERDLGEISHSGNQFSCEFQPHEIKTLKVCFT
jgi:alpha-mannosidase